MYIKRYVSMFICIMASCLAAIAIPAQKGVWRNIVLADGSIVRAELCGDEHLSFFQDAAEQCYYKADNGHYQMLDYGQLTILNEKATAKRAGINDERQRRVAKEHLNGSQKGLIILVNFADNTFQEGHDRAFFERFANEKGFNEGRFHGSVHDYFYDQSRGKFDLSFDVVGPFTLSHDIEWYGHHYGLMSDARTGTMIKEACTLADPYVDYKDYDWDGDGQVEQVFVLYAGFGEADGGDENTIWPQESTLSQLIKTPLTADDVVIDVFGCANELSGVRAYDANGKAYYTGEGRICGIGSICHEYSHCLGFPDTYAVTGNGLGMSFWDIMSSGNYLDNSYCPAGYTSWERWTAGWLEPIELTETKQVDNMRPLTQDGDSYIIYLDNPDRTEYLLLESRQPMGWDSYLYNHGLLIMHVDYKESFWTKNTVNGVSYHQRMTIENADNDTTQYQQSKWGDIYPYDPNAIWGKYVTENHPTVKSLLEYLNQRDGCTYNTFYNNELSQTSKPAIWQFNGTHQKQPVEGRAIRNIIKRDDLSVSFTFEKTSTDGIADVPCSGTTDTHYYSLTGHRLASPQPGITIMRSNNGTIRKILSKNINRLGNGNN